MPYRNLFVTNETTLRLRKGQLVADNGEVFTFPVEDIRCVVIDSDRSTLSAQLIAFLAENNVCLLICNRSHLPVAQLLPVGTYCRVQKRIRLQIVQSKPKCKRLWQKIVMQKIENQARCLELAQKSGAEQVRAFASGVQSGDSTNREGCAARAYFPLLFGKDFTREREIPVNAALNYGYAILRGFLAKTLVAYGLEPALGLHHQNQLNAFNLADDLLEPFRPIVDLYTEGVQTDLLDGLKTVHKAELVRLLNCAVTVNGRRCSLAHAVELLVQSLISAFETDEVKLGLPQLEPIAYFAYD